MTQSEDLTKNEESGKIPVIVKNSQMAEAFQTAVVDLTAKALQNHTNSTSIIDVKLIATDIKQALDKRYSNTSSAVNGVYYVVVGESFACNSRLWNVAWWLQVWFRCSEP